MQGTKVISIVPTTLLAPVALFVKLAASDTVIIEKHETYSKQSFRNRYEIAAPNKIQALSIPVIKVNGNHTKTFDIEIDYKTNWMAQHLKSIETAYKSSPFYIYYIDFIANEFYRKPNKLWDLNNALFKLMLKWLNIECKTEYSNDFFTFYSDADDYRNIIHPKTDWHKQHFIPYPQCFDEKFGFRPGLSVIDLLFNLGPESSLFVKNKWHKHA